MNKSQAPAEFLGSTGFLIAQLGRESRAAWAGALADRALTPSAHAVLLVLRQRGPLPMTDLAAAVHTDPRNMGPVLDGMGPLVERGHDARDRRRHTVGLTRLGRSRADELADATGRLEDAFLSPLSATERSTLHRLLTKLRDARASGS